MGKNPALMGTPLSRIRPLHTGHYTMPSSDTRFPDDRIIVRAFLIEHPRGLFLFDTGFSAADRRAVETFAPWPSGRYGRCSPRTVSLPRTSG